MPRTLTIIVLFVVCAIAAAAGGYIAVRQSAPAAVSPAQASADAGQGQGVAVRPVAEVTAGAGAGQGTVPAQAASGTEALVPEPPVASANSTVAPAPVIDPVRSTVAPKSSTSAVKTKPLPERFSQATTAPSRPLAAPSDRAVSGRLATAQAAGTPVGAEPPAVTSLTPQLSAPPDPPRPPATPPPPVPMFEEVVVPAESVLGLQMLTTTSTEEAKVEDPVEAKVTRDVRIRGTVAIPAGTRVLGVVTVAERGGKVKGKARLGVRFHMLVLADAAATRVPIRTDTIFRESESQGQQSAGKIGAAAAGGAILGAILGGGKGAVIGGALGAGGGTANVMQGDRSQATLQAGTAITVRLQDALTVTVER